MAETNKATNGDTRKNLNSSLKNSSTANEATDAERDLAQQSMAEFNKCNYSAALSSLNKLLISRPSDIKVLMNKAVVDYYKGSLKKTDAFRKTISSLCPKVGMKAENENCCHAEYSVIMLNHAIILYHLHQYQAAVAILELMNTTLDTLEESVGIGVCLLLAECYLGMYQPSHSLNLLSHTEATFMPQPLPSHSSSPKQLQQDKDSKSPEKVIPPSGNSSSTSSLNSSNGSSGPGSEEIKSSPNQELRSKLQLLRVRALLMMRVLRLGKKELKSIVTQVVNSGNQSNMTLINLKSQLEYLKGNHRKAIKVLNQCGAIPPPSPTCGPKLGIVYYNNQGVIHFGLGKPTLACLYLQKALEELQMEQKTFDEPIPGESLSNRSIYQVSSVVGPELCYNLGVTLIHMNKPCRAFEFLLDALQAYPNNPRLWLRLAECCIFSHNKRLKEDIGLDNVKSSMTGGPHGTSPHAKLNISQSINNHDKSLQEQLKVTDAAFPEPTLEFSRMCLMNALSLLPKNVSVTPFTDEQEASGVVPELYPASPSSPMRGSEVMSIRASCLTCSSYVALCVNDYPAALKHAQALLSLHPCILPVHKLLGHLYAGEALICLGKVSEALSHLDPNVVGDISLIPTPPEVGQVPINSQNTHGWYPSNTATATQIMRYNLSAAYALRGELDKSHGLIKEVWNGGSGNMPAQIVMLALYIQLRLGNVDAMKNIIKSKVLT